MTAEPAEDRVYYPALDGLRFLAFALVYLFHRGIPQVAGGIDAAGRVVGYRPTTAGRAPWSLGNAILDNGWVGVQLFFLLSGFLITTLLLREESRAARIDLRAFWVRRILRIWPLYYVIILLTFVVIPWLDDGLAPPGVGEFRARQGVLFLLFAGNWSMGLIGPAPYDTISVLWSVCVEEQFYLVAPLLIAWARPSRRLGIVAAGMAVAIVGRAALAALLQRQAITPLLFQYGTVTQLDTLLAGVLLALVRERRPSALSARAIHFWEIAAWFGLVAILLRPGLAKGTVPHMTFDFAAIWAVGMAIVAVAASDKSWTSHVFAYGRLVWLGRISYGLYMYHEIAFWMHRAAFDWLGWFPNKEALAPFASLALTVALASASYRWLERPFLRWKRRWSRVESRPI